jgi:hypothetical protein
MSCNKFAIIGFSLLGAFALNACNSADDFGDTDEGAALGGSGGVSGSLLESRRLAGVGLTGTGGWTAIIIPYGPGVESLSGDFKNNCERCWIIDTDEGSRLDCLCHGLPSNLSLPCGFATTNGSVLACHALPKGSYARSCRNCAFGLVGGQGQLNCECKDFTGAWKAQPSPLVIPVTGCARVANYDGKLACVAEEGAPCEFPGGSFIRSCANCTMNCDGTPSMSCVCAPSSSASTIAPSSCYDTQVWNRLGELLCG